MLLSFFRKPTLSIPNEVIPLLLMQRTRTQQYVNSKDATELNEEDLDLFKKEASEIFHRDFKQFEKSLPKSVSSFVDIGCGLGFLDVLIMKKFRHTAKAYLIDKTQVEDEVWYGFKDQPAFYNSLGKTKQVMLSNHIGLEEFHLLEADTNPFSKIPLSPDLIVSFLSWGWHYPLETYLGAVLDISNSKTVLIVDVRKESSGLDLLKKHFSSVQISKNFMNSSKGYRVVCNGKF